LTSALLSNLLISTSTQVSGSSRYCFKEINDERLKPTGEPMYQLHKNYSACGLGWKATDRIVELAGEAVPGQGIFGPKIVSGRSGGAVAILSHRDVCPVVGRVAERHAS
jgi:hypothetical protein